MAVVSADDDDGVALFNKQTPFRSGIPRKSNRTETEPEIDYLEKIQRHVVCVGRLEWWWHAARSIVRSCVFFANIFWSRPKKISVSPTTTLTLPSSTVYVHSTEPWKTKKMITHVLDSKRRRESGNIVLPVAGRTMRDALRRSALRMGLGCEERHYAERGT